MPPKRITEADFAAAARRLGAKRSELVSIERTADGVVIGTADGKYLIEVPDDRPDAEGKTGLMLLQDPHPRSGRGASTAFPVFARAVEGDDSASADEEDPDA
ncbi:MAG: hypothetical protein AB7H43_15270 [Acidimicrobiia bacterium]